MDGAVIKEKIVGQRFASHFLLLLVVGVLITFLASVLSHMLRLSQGGEWLLPLETASMIQTYQQALTWTSAGLIVAAAGIAFFRYPDRKWVSYPLYFAAVLITGLVLAAGLLAAVQTALRLFILAFGLISITASLSWNSRKTALLSPFAKTAALTLIFMFVLLVSGTVVTAIDANQACSGWPLCSGQLPVNSLGWLAFMHRLMTLLTGFLVTGMFLRAWRTQRSQQVILTAATVVFILFAGQILISAVMTLRSYTPDLVGLHAVSSSALWGALVILVTATAFAARTRQEEAEEAAQPLPLKRRFKDFIVLSKPIIVLLLLVTTYAGMVVGGKSIPTLALTFWTMLGGALAAGGSSALNQFIDRDLDKDMHRTAKRPLPDGRLTPGEGLAYGAGTVVLSFFLLAAFVNLLAALLSLAGAIYYVLLYSIWLKRLTVQNIVIGGGAGAIPPLVGWAAASGGLNIPSLFLFAIVFLWTPPHFWALALVRRKDYARARVPMLPVVQGVHATRKQIFIYTLELVALTLLMPVFKITGSVFLISAVVLGAWLIHTAWKVLQDGGNKVAWKMYRYSSMYLAFLFLALVVDVLI
jgi:heme o synthase